MSDNIDKVRTKIAALMKKTQENGASESEAMAAMAIAEKLMSEYGVTLDDIKNNAQNTRDFTKRRFGVGKKLSVLDKIVAPAIARYTDTKVWNNLVFAGFKQGRTSTGKARMKTESNLMFYGYSVDVELAEYIYNVCDIAIDTEWNRFMVTVPRGMRKQIRSSFILGMTVRIRDRLDEMKKDNVVRSGSKDLMVLKSQLVETAFKEGLGITLGKPSGGVSAKNFTSSVYDAGKQAGDRVRFNREVHDGPAGGVKMIA